MAWIWGLGIRLPTFGNVGHGYEYGCHGFYFIFLKDFTEFMKMSFVYVPF